MTEKRFTVPIKYRLSHSKIQLNGEPLTNDELVRILNINDGAFLENFVLKEEKEQLKKQRKELLRLIDNNIEIYENINTNVEFHQGEIQGKLTLLNNLRKVILND